MITNFLLQYTSSCFNFICSTEVKNKEITTNYKTLRFILNNSKISNYEQEKLLDSCIQKFELQLDDVDFFTILHSLEKKLGPKKFYQLIETHKPILKKIANSYLLFLIHLQSQNTVSIDAAILDHLFDKSLFLTLPQRDYPLFLDDTFRYISIIKDEKSLSSSDEVTFFKTNIIEITKMYRNIFDTKYQLPAWVSKKKFPSLHLLNIIMALHSLNNPTHDCETSSLDFLINRKKKELESSSSSKKLSDKIISIFKIDGPFLNNGFMQHLTYMMGIRPDAVITALSQIKGEFPQLETDINELYKKLYPRLTFYDFKSDFDIFIQ